MINTELYHYGIKGMKWRKRKTTQQLARTYETNARREDALYDATWDEIKKPVKRRNNAKIDRLQSATVTAMDNTWNSSSELRKRSKKAIKKIQKADPKRRLVDNGPTYKDVLSAASGSIRNVSGTEETKAKGQKKVKRKVANANRKYKAKKFITSLFKG